MINVFQPALGSAELAAVEQVFDSNWVGKGAITEQFEAQFASYLDVTKSQVRSVSCCTEGLFQSMVLLNIGPGDEVILPTVSFVGAANAIVSSGAIPVFCDVDPRTLNPTADHIDAKITTKTKAVIILHYGGVPCYMDQISDLVKLRNLALIEDSACSIASRYNGQACGTFGDIGIWSFDAMKILVTGDGGMLYCQDEILAQSAATQLYLGLQTASGFASQVNTRWWEFEVSLPGRRAVMNDIASAIGIEQLKKLSAFIARRQEIHNYYNQTLAFDWLQLPPEIPSYMTSSYYFYWIQIAPHHRDQLARYLRDHGIYTTFRYYPLHWVNFYRSETRLPQAEEAANSTLCLPIHQSLTNDDLDKITTYIAQFGKNLLI